MKNKETIRKCLEGEALNAFEISERTGIAVSSVYRCLKQLMPELEVIKDDGFFRYRLKKKIEKEAIQAIQAIQPIQQTQVQYQVSGNFLGIPVFASHNHQAFVPQFNENELIKSMYFELVANDIARLINAHRAILLQGHAGSFKNYILFYLAYKCNRPLIRINCSSDLRTSSLLGRFTPIPGSDSFEWQDGLITQAVRNGFWLILDEINSLDADILFALHGLLDENRISIANNSEIVQAHSEFRLFATMNPNYVGTRALNQALLDRFSVIQVEYDKEIDQALIEKLDLNDNAKTAFYNLILRIRGCFEDRQISMPFSHRTLKHIVDLQNNGFPVDRAIELAYLNKLDSDERKIVKTLIDDFVREAIKNFGR
jgi:nitric oxide reductase NorQ protein